jgi:hypothetical protein
LGSWRQGIANERFHLGRRGSHRLRLPRIMDFVPAPAPPGRNRGSGNTGAAPAPASAVPAANAPDRGNQGCAQSRRRGASACPRGPARSCRRGTRACRRRRACRGNGATAGRRSRNDRCATRARPDSRQIQKEPGGREGAAATQDGVEARHAAACPETGRAASRKARVETRTALKEESWAG